MMPSGLQTCFSRRRTWRGHRKGSAIGPAAGVKRRRNAPTPAATEFQLLSPHVVPTPVPTTTLHQDSRRGNKMFEPLTNLPLIQTVPIFKIYVIDSSRNIGNDRLLNFSSI